MAGADATIVVVIERTKKALRDAGATSVEAAKTPKALGLRELWLKTSAGAGVVSTADGRYYLRTKRSA